MKTKPRTMELMPGVSLVLYESNPKKRKPTDIIKIKVVIPGFDKAPNGGLEAWIEGQREGNNKDLLMYKATLMEIGTKKELLGLDIASFNVIFAVQRFIDEMRQYFTALKNGILTDSETHRS